MNRTRALIPALLLCVTGGFLTGCEEEDPVDANVACFNSDPNRMPLEPQICPRVNPINFCEQYIPGDGPAELATWELMLDNRGQGVLEIDDFEVLHDRRCAFAEPNGGVELWDNDDGDDFAATVRSRGAAFLRIEYRPPSPGTDSVTIRVHSNAENFPELDIYVCGGGTNNDRLTCQIRTDPECSASGAACDSSNPCPGTCFLSGASCDAGSPCAGEGDFCNYQEYCVPNEEVDPENPTAGTCQCRPCAVPPNEDWTDCGN